MGEEEKEYPEHKDSAEKALPSEKKSEECAEKEYPSEIEHLGKTAKEVNLSMERSKQNGKVALFVLAVFAMLFSFVLGGASCYFYYFSYPGFQLLKSEANGTKQEEINLPRVSKKLGELQDLIHDNYLYTENGVDAENGIYKGLLNSLLEQDPYAQYYTKEEIDQTVERQKGVYQGIGASVSETPDGPKIEFVYAGSPAESGTGRGRQFPGDDCRAGWSGSQPSHYPRESGYPGGGIRGCGANGQSTGGSGGRNRLSFFTGVLYGSGRRFYKTVRDGDRRKEEGAGD